MSRLRHTDIIVELIDLCQERMTEIRQQLVYYRASVYKGETAAQIGETLTQLRLVATLLGDEMLVEAFGDYDAMAKAGVLSVAPGECSFSMRVTTLLFALEGPLVRLARQGTPRAPAVEGDTQLAQAVRERRHELLALCRQGTRQWAFFESV
jgi:hypothetical protein